MLELILILVLIGLLLTIIQKQPIDPTVLLLIRIVVIIAVILWLIQIFGVDVPIPRWRR